MPTPDFEDWLERQDIPVEATTTKERYTQYMIDEYGFTKGSIDIIEKQYEEKYEIYAEVGIRAVERHYLYMGEPFVETRYAISGEPGLWGRVMSLVYAEERWTARGEPEKAEIARSRLEELEKYPERIRVRWEERE